MADRWGQSEAFETRREGRAVMLLMALGFFVASPSGKKEGHGDFLFQASWLRQCWQCHCEEAMLGAVPAKQRKER